MKHLDQIPVASVLVIIAAVAGAVVAIIHPAALPFEDYLRDVAIGAGLLGVGRGLHGKQKP